MSGPDSTKAISVNDVFCLHVTPRGAVAALRGLTLDVARGEKVVVHGPNGSGKTTFIKTLTGEQPVQAGSVSVNGVDLVGARESTLRKLRARSIGVVEQHAGRTLRPELDVIDNVALQSRISGMSKQAAGKRAADLLARLGLSDLESRSTWTLSGGEAQRVAICAALAHEPRVVLADEPTGELDASAADAVYDLLGRAVGFIGASLVLVTHDARAAKVADRALRIRDGRLGEQWDPQTPGVDPTLVVDDRGWVRLPERLRVETGSTSGVMAGLAGRSIVLTGVDPYPPRTTDAGVGPHRAATSIQVDATSGPIVQASGLMVRRSGRTVLCDVDVEAARGQLVAIVGPSGSGKSTLLRVLIGLEAIDAGQVLLGGQSLDRLDREARALLRRAHVAHAAQGTSLAEAATVMENLSLARAVRDATHADPSVHEVCAMLALVGLLDRPVRQLSGGERQRVALARALVSGAPLVVADEPTSQLDEASAERAVESLHAATQRGVAVIVATHDPVLVGAAHQILDLGASVAEPAQINR
jgi:ABC-type lipoprotein export system ATPase subunit